jgi:heme exporter protein D
MYFTSLNELVTMGGHGGYVWSAYIVSLIVIIALLVVPARQCRAELRRIAAQAASSTQRKAKSKG